MVCHVSIVDLENDLHIAKSTTRQPNKHSWTLAYPLAWEVSSRANTISIKLYVFGTKVYRVAAAISGALAREVTKMQQSHSPRLHVTTIAFLLCHAHPTK